MNGIPVCISPHLVGIGSCKTHVIYPSSEKSQFILEDFDSGDSHTLDASSGGTPIKFVFGKHSVALLTSNNVLFWGLDSATPLESWNGKVEDVYCDYGDWILKGPNVSFDPELQDSKSVTIESKPILTYKYKPVWVGKLLHVGNKVFDVGPISSISVIDDYIVMVHEQTIKVLFNLEEFGEATTAEPSLAVAAAIIDDSLEAYCITPSKVAQYSLDLDFEPISPVEDGADDSLNPEVLYSGLILAKEEPSNELDRKQSEPVTMPQSPRSVVDSEASTPAQSSQDLLALLHGKKPQPPKDASTHSLPGPKPGIATPPVQLPETTDSETLMKLIRPAKKEAPVNKATKSPKKSSGDHSACVPRSVFDTAVELLKEEIAQLHDKVKLLERGKPEEKPEKQKAKKQSETKVIPASIADAIQRTTEGEDCLEYLEKHVSELNTYLAGAPHDKAQMLRLILIDSYHHTDLSAALVRDFGTPTINANYFNKIVGKEQNR